MVEGQLTMLAPGLSNENRVETKTIIAQELVAHIEAFENSNLAYTRTNYFDAQEEALNVAVDRAREVLSKILTADEMATWEDFEEHKAERMMEQTYDMQLGMFAAGLTPENKAMVRDVMVDEEMFFQDAMYG
jgi:hypothetical protein